MLRARSEYLTPRYLASSHLDLPYLNSECFWGQQIILHYCLPKSLFSPSLTLIVDIRYGSREIETLTIPLSKREGTWIYRLLGENFTQKEGILSYKATLTSPQGILATWQHHLWTDLIDL